MKMLNKVELKKSDFKIIRNFIIALILVLLTGIYMNYFMFEEDIVQSNPLSGFPEKIGRWEKTANHSLGHNILDILKVDEYLMRDYQSEKGTASLYIGYYKSHRNSAEIHTPEHCQAGGGWEVLSQQIKELDMQAIGKRINITEAVYEKDQEKMVFLYWYYLNGKYVTSFFHYKMSVILNSLINHRSDASFIRITVPVKNDNIGDAIDAGEMFLRDFVPYLDLYLPSK